MKEAWPDSADTYRSRSRKKKKDADTLTELLNRVEALEKNQRAPDQLFLHDPQADASPSQRRSSVGSSHLDGCGGSYPVDYVTEKTDCELHMLFRTASVKVAVGYVYPSEDGATHHHMPIPPGCVHVGVDEVVPGFETVELDIPRGDDERTLADVKHNFALWLKKYIVLLQRPPNPTHEQQMPSTPPGSSPREQPSPHLPERDPSVSPPSRDPPRKTTPVKRNGTPPRKRSRKEKPQPPIEKLPWEKSVEENREAVESELRAFFAPKVPEIPFEKTLDPVKVVRTVENLYDPVPSPPSDYRRSIERSYEKMIEATKPVQSGIKEIKGIHQVYELGQQPIQSVPPLKVFDGKAVQSSRQNPTDYAIAETTFKFGQGKDLVENLRKLTTCMRNLHSWYLNASKGGTETIMVRVSEEHYFQEYCVNVDFSELFQLYNLRALDKSIISLSKMLECKRDEITNIGFIDPHTMHVKTIEDPLYNKDTPETLLREGVNSFLLVAEANKSKQGFMCCPCLKCKNEKDYSCSRDIKSHLLRFGFMSSYNVWTKHGEEGVMMEDGDEEEDNDDQYRSMFSECDDTAMDDNEEEGGEEQASDDPVDDDLRRAISDARRDCGTDKERLQFNKMLEDHHKLLYPGCEDGHRKLGSILELLKWKAEVGVTDSGFEKLMIILKKLFPRNNELPVSTYEAKKFVCPLGLDVQKIHACINDCILYRGEKYENLNKCPICGALRYKIRKDDPGDVEGEPPRKRVPAKVMWYAPIIPRLKRLFRNKEHAKLLRWHMEERKKDAMLRHPADGRQWRNIGREFPDFAEGNGSRNFVRIEDMVNVPTILLQYYAHLLVHLVEESRILGPVFLHNMFPFERFMGVLKKYVHNRARPEGSISKGYGTEEVIEFCVDFLPDLKPIGVPESRYEGRLTGKGTLGRKSRVCRDKISFNQAHYTVLYNSILVAPYIEKHKNALREINPGQPESLITREHMNTFGSWLQRHLINDPSAVEQLYLLARLPSSNICTFQGYEINGNTFYTMDQDKKSTNQNSGVRFDAKDENGQTTTYYGYIEEIWELDYGPTFKVPLFRCKWVRLSGIHIDDKYGMITVDPNNLAYLDEPFVLASEVAQVFYVKDMSSKSRKRNQQKNTSTEEPKRHIVLSGKRNIVGVDEKTDMSEDYNKFKEIPPFTVKIDPSILLNDEDSPWLRRRRSQH
ncbi:hypothetical protein QYE76_033882 [Lolium multiflorum]|uniref:Transposon protein, putative, CACTA, En/Spm sub-class n=1 Tax=Lolium multiflorum TaxID=4521 RepID=A0AAD8QYH0_LOLMU|nr:hypothetical protein QYE76_033882 [Lolium multiflorum]